MTVCERLSDRMPDVLRGHARWTAEEAAHLAGCADCRAEQDLIAAVHRIAARAPAPRDPLALAETVLRRVANQPRSRLRSLRSWAVGIAAAAGIALAVWTGSDREGIVSDPAAVAAGADIALPELEPMETAELDSLLETMEATPPPAPAAWSALGEPTLGDLDADELEQVLGTWEG
ncbi:MAG: hypothetical protein H0W29_12550 [Gemmatimonadales bacterium]|nr:hypothetical protein [Gemmatimonadales bacterium]